MKLRSTPRWLALTALALLSGSQVRAQDPYYVQNPPPARPVPAAIPGTPVPAAPVKADLMTGASFTDSSSTALACPSGGCCREPRIALFADVLYLRARNIDVHYAELTNGPIEGPPAGTISNSDTNYSPGFRVGAAYALDKCSFLQFTGTWWQSNSHGIINAAPGQTLQALTTLPITRNNLTTATGADAADSDYNQYLYMIDLDYKHTFLSGCNYSLAWVSGVRYAHMEQNEGLNYAIVGKTSVDTAINFDGIGPRVGLEGEHLLRGGFMMYGRTMANLLAGHFGSSYRQSNTHAGNQANIGFEEDRLVPVLDLELGLAWVNCSGRFRIECGYFLSAWFNTVTTPGLIEGVTNNSFSGVDSFWKDCFTLDGVTLRFVVTF